MPKTSIGGRHIAKERGLFPAWSGWPFRREAPNAIVVRRNPRMPRATKDRCADERTEPMPGVITAENLATRVAHALGVVLLAAAIRLDLHLEAVVLHIDTRDQQRSFTRRGRETLSSNQMLCHRRANARPDVLHEGIYLVPVGMPSRRLADEGGVRRCSDPSRELQFRFLDGGDVARDAADKDVGAGDLIQKSLDLIAQAGSGFARDFRAIYEHQRARLYCCFHVPSVCRTDDFPLSCSPGFPLPWSDHPP
jgi:hypothetical protein